MTGKDDQEPFPSRWSRLKQESRQQAEEKRTPDTDAAGKAPAPELPPIDKLTLESDYRGFFHPKVGEDVRRAALKKLFGDPHFNVMDGLDVYIEDYSRSESIPAAMLAGLRQAQQILDWSKERRAAAEPREDGESAGDESAGPAALEEQPSTASAPVRESDSAPASADDQQKA